MSNITPLKTALSAEQEETRVVMLEDLETVRQRIVDGDVADLIIFTRNHKRATNIYGNIEDRVLLVGALMIAIHDTVDA